MARRGSGRATSAILESGLAESWRRFAAFPPKVPSSTAKWSCWARIGKPSFQGLQYFNPKDSGRLCFYAFDLLHLNGADLMAQPLEERRAALADLVADVHPQIRFSDTLDSDPRTLMPLLREQDGGEAASLCRLSRREDAAEGEQDSSGEVEQSADGALSVLGNSRAREGQLMERRYDGGGTECGYLGSAEAHG